MKKTLSLLCATAIFVSPIVPNVYAENTNTNPSTEQNTQQTPAIPTLDKLTLQEVIERGIQNNKNLTVLQLNLEATTNQVLDTEYDLGQAKWDIKDLEDRIDDLKDASDSLTGALKSANFQERVAITNSLDMLQDQVQALELAIKQLETGKIQLQLQGDELKEGVRLLLTSTYTNLVVLNKQINFTKKAISSAATDVKKAQRMYALGMGSKEAVRLATVAKTNLQKQLEELQKKYNQDVAKLSFDIGILFNPNMKILPIQHTPVAQEKPADLTAHINKSFKIQKAQKSLDSAITSRDDAYREYKEKDYVGADISTYELQQKDAQVKAAEETLKLTKDQVKTALDQLYYNASNTKFLYDEALRKAENIKKDVYAIQIRYKAGLISKQSYEAAKLQLQQANLNVETIKLQNFLTNETLKATELGYIQ